MSLSESENALIRQFPGLHKYIWEKIYDDISITFYGYLAFLHVRKNFFEINDDVSIPFYGYLSFLPYN